MVTALVEFRSAALREFCGNKLALCQDCQLLVLEIDVQGGCNFSGYNGPSGTCHFTPEF